MNDDPDSDFDELEFDVWCTLFETDDEFTEHQATGTCGFICEPCGVAFKFETHLKIHTERHCTKCCKEFHANDNSLISKNSIVMMAQCYFTATLAFIYKY
jgi:hypothetical protein